MALSTAGHRSRLGRILAAVVVLGALLAPASTAASEMPPGGDFRLTSVDGAVSLADLRGDVVLVSFGYTHCPDVCPTTMFSVARTLRLLDPAVRARTHALFVTLDPERDDAERLASYVAHFEPGIVGLTGDADAIAAVAASYGVKSDRVDLPESGMGYAVNHSAASYMIAPDGALRHVIPYESPPAKVALAISQLLDEADTAGMSARVEPAR